MVVNVLWRSARVKGPPGGLTGKNTRTSLSEHAVDKKDPIMRQKNV